MINLFQNSTDPDKTWENFLKRLGYFHNDSFNITLDNLSFSSTFIPGGFPTELILKNSHTKVCVYDNNFEIKIGESSINYSKDNSEENLFIRSVLNKEQFNYLYQVSLCQKNLFIRFGTPWFGLDKIKNLPLTKPIIFTNCTFMIFNEPPNY